MKGFPTSEKLRESAEEFYKKEEKPSPKGALALFVKYLEAYCAELNRTEWDVLHSDETWEEVYSIFSSICRKNSEALQKIS